MDFKIAGSIIGILYRQRKSGKSFRCRHKKISNLLDLFIRYANTKSIHSHRSCIFEEREEKQNNRIIIYDTIQQTRMFMR